MRLLPMLLVLPLLALQAHAQPAPPPPAAPAAAAHAAAASTASSAGPAAMAPAAQATAPTAEQPATAPATTAQDKPKPRRMTWQQRFAGANVTHDGHLTLQQAETGYRTIARHFTEIDADKKGYVTVEDIDNWHRLQRAMRKTHHGRSLEPRPAMHQEITQPHQINASAATTVEK